MEKSQPRKYYCEMERSLFNLEKHIFNRIWYGTTHILGLYGLYLWLIVGVLPNSAVILTFIFGVGGGLGVTIGSHRLWTHKTFKATLPLKIILMYCQTTGALYTIFTWAVHHRLHHKFVETAADPHDARRGFWFSHIGWLLVKEHPAVKEKEATIDFSDLDNDPVVRFQKKYFWPLKLLCVFIVPMATYRLVWPELSFFPILCHNSFWILVCSHCTWSVNSIAHLYGYRPYDKSFYAADSLLVGIIAVGEGYHNYHHVFPWDYKAAELGMYRYNWSTCIIDLFAKIGWAYDMKTVADKVIQERIGRTGDGSYHEYIGFYTNSNEPSKCCQEQEMDERHTHVGVVSQDDCAPKVDDTKGQKDLPAWGWGDEDISNEHYRSTTILNPSKSD